MQVYMLVLCMLHHSWIITESNDVRSSGNSEVWGELQKKLKDVKAMVNENFVAIQQRMRAEQELKKIENAALREMQERMLCDLKQKKEHLQM